MTHGILKFSVFVTLTLTINFLIYHVLTSLTPSLSGPNEEPDHKADNGADQKPDHAQEPDHETELARNRLSPAALERLVSTLARVSALAPGVRPSPGCVAPALKTLVCEAHTGLRGPHLVRPRRLVLMILFGFEVDTLEITLREQLTIVDKVFIVESSVTHKGSRKPLMWNNIRETERFDFVNKSKVEHVVFYPPDSRNNTGDIWLYEDLQTQAGVSAIRRWSQATGHLGDSDLVISADVDEVLSQDALNHLRHCQLSAPIISGAIIMPFGNLDMAFRSDFPVEGKPHSYALPTIYSWSLIKSGQADGKRGVMSLRASAQPARQTSWVMGGIHMTGNSFVPASLLKDLTATEYVGALNMNDLKDSTQEDFNLFQDSLYNLDYAKPFQRRLDPVDSITDMQRFVPWFLKCNPQRYPYWFGKPDQRNRDLQEALKEYFESKSMNI